MLAVELSEFTRRVFKDGLRRRFPELDEHALHALYLERMAKCYNTNY